jgi:SAM-dependent methyltransferase
MTDTDFQPRRFRSTVPFYSRFRLSYPDELIAEVGRLAGLKPGERVLDLGCGPGLLAIPFAQAGARVTGVDPEPDMLAAAEEEARRAGVSIDFRQGSSFDLPMDIGPLRLVTMGRSFHWMDRPETLRILDGLVVADGAVALFHDDHPPTAENAWIDTLREVAKSHGAQSAGHGRTEREPGYRSHVSWLLDSAFSKVRRAGVFVRRGIDIDHIVGFALSLSVLSPEKLGERAAAFEADLRAALGALSPDGKFTEIAELTAIVARRS